MLYKRAQFSSAQVQGDPKRPAEVHRWAPSSKSNDSRSGSGDILTIAASILGCLAIFLKVYANASWLLYALSRLHALA